MNDNYPDRGFFALLRKPGIIRQESGWMGGVAAGISQRTGLDVTLVRGLFVVLTLFAGAGAMVYAVAWALLPDTQDQVHVQQAVSGRWTSGMTGAVIVFVAGFILPSIAFGPSSGFLWTAAVIAAVLVLVFQRQGTKFDRSVPQTSPAGDSAAETGESPTEGTANFQSAPLAPNHRNFTEEAMTKPLHNEESLTRPLPSNESLTQPLRHEAERPHDMSAPHQPPLQRIERPRPLTAGVTSVILGFAVLVFTAVLAVQYWSYGFTGAALYPGFASALLVVGLGIVGAALNRRTAVGLIIAAILLALATLISGAVIGDSFNQPWELLPDIGTFDLAAVNLPGVQS